MLDRTIKLPEFKSVEHFKAWWNSPEVAQLRAQLADHPGVKPWLSQLKDEITLKPFGKYNLERKLGQGGMGAVYLAYDTVLNRQVAVKIVVLEDEESIQRFMREARATAKLKHPNIITVYDFGAFEKYYYLTMDYIEGPSLEARIKDKNNRLTPRQVAEMFYQIALAVDYAHNEGIIHRDIKPSNILIDQSGNAHLTDFSLAKELSSSKIGHSLTLSGTILGTPSYMSPEQARGDKARIGPRSDIFSLGATLYHALTGQTPFKTGEIYEILDSVVNADPTPPRKVLVSINQDLETICIKCLEKDPATRYQTAGELARDLRHYLDGEAISATPLGLATKAWRKVKKNKIVSISVLTTALVLLAVAIVLAIFSHQRNQEIELYRREAYSEFKVGHYKDALEWANKVIALDPADAEMEILGEKCDRALRAEREKITSAKRDAELEAEGVKQQAEIRAKARAVLDRKNMTTDSDEIIRIAEESLKIDPTFGEAYQAIGYAYKDKGDYKSAYEYFTKAIETTPTLAYSYYELGWIVRFTYKNPIEAAKYFEKVIEYDPQSHLGYLARAGIFASKDKDNEAVKNYTRAIEINPNLFSAYYGRGCSYFQLADYQQAFSDFNKAVELAPDDGDSHHARASCYLRMKDYERALADANKTVELKSNLDKSYALRGDVYQRMRRYDLAIADYTSAIEIKPDCAETYNNRGIVFALQGNYDRALADYTQALKLDPFNSVVWSNRGIAFGNKNDFKQAIADFTRALKLDPLNKEAYARRGAAYVEINDFDRAVADSAKVIELSPSDPWAYSDRAMIYFPKKDYQRAKADLNKAIQLNPKNYSFYVNLGLVNGEDNKPELALECYNKAIALAPESDDPYFCRGRFYYERDNLDKALKDLNKAIELNPENVGAYVTRGLLYEKKNDLPSAVADTRMALKLAPDNPDASKWRVAIARWSLQLNDDNK